MSGARVLLWSLWTLTTVTVSIVALAFVYYRPTAYVGDTYVDPRSVDIAATIIASISLLSLGFSLWRLLRK